MNYGTGSVTGFLESDFMTIGNVKANVEFGMVDEANGFGNNKYAGMFGLAYQSLAQAYVMF